MSLIRLIDFNLWGDERGSLVAVEGGKSVPFDIKRAYYLFGTGENVARGFHAHKNLIQVAVPVAGRCRFVLDDGVVKSEVLLDSPTKGLVIEKMIWHEMYDFSQNCVLLVLASDHYDESDYIRNYDNFLSCARDVRQ
ncbi:MAG: FdtA/QdtA family cupin domain-containing protein [Gammaproteobacteria bacterium]